MEYSHVEIARSLRREKSVISNLELLPLDIFVREGFNYPDTRQIIFDLSKANANMNGSMIKAAMER